MSLYETERIKADYPISEQVAKHVKLTRNGKEFKGLCPFHAESTPSFTVSDEKQFYHCFGCGAGGDVIKFVQAMHNVEFREACKIITGDEPAGPPNPERRESIVVDDYAGLEPAKPTGAVWKAGVRTPRLYNPKKKKGEKGEFTHYTPSIVSTYRAADGSFLGYVLRVDFEDGSKILPTIRYARLPDGTESWTHWTFTEPRPLYGLDLLAKADPAAQVFICEGEKATDACRRLLGVTAVTWPGGTNAVDKADWTPLRGRNVVIWPDADAPGWKAAQEIAPTLAGIGCTVKVIDTREGMAKGWDAADADAEGMDRAAAMAWGKARVALWTPAASPQAPAKAKKPAPAKQTEPERAPPISESDLKGVIAKHGAPKLKTYRHIEEAIEDFNTEYAVVHEGSKVGILREVIDEHDSRALSVISEKGFETLTANRLLVIDNKDVPISKLWLKSPQRRQYDGRDFRPDGKCPPNILNLWRGFSYVPKEGAGQFDVFLDHILSNICGGDPTLAHWVTAWIADMFQNPARKSGTAMVMRGGMGVGKGVFANHIGKLVSRHYMATSQASQITGKFNGHMADKLLMFIDEGFWAGDKSAEGPFKSIVTEETVTVEYKGKDAIKMQSYIRFMVASNNDWVVPAGLDERRFAIFDVGDTVKGNFDYFKKMGEQLSAGGYEALLHYLLNYVYEPSLVRTIPKTKGLLDQKLASMSMEMKWWFDCLSDGKIGTGTNWPPGTVMKDDFYAAYLEWADSMKGRHPVGKQQLAHILKKQAGLDAAAGRTRLGYHYELPSLEDARKAFNGAIGHSIAWDTEENDKQSKFNYDEGDFR